MANNRNLSLALGSFSLAVFVFAKLSFLIGLNNSMFMSALVTAGLVFAFITLIASLAHSFTPVSADTKRIVRGVQAAAIIVLIVSLLTGGFGSLLASYIHF